MNKENILFGIIGVLLGLIVGFMFANSVNKNNALPVATGASQTLPEGHPNTGAGVPPGPMSPEAQAAIEKATNEPGNFDAQVKAAELFYKVQNYDRAIEFLKQANKLNPEDYEIIVHLGNATFDSDKFDEAEKWYEKALKIKTDDVAVRTDLGLTFMFRQPPDYDRAIREFNLSLETDGTHSQTLQNLTVAYTKTGDAANAGATLARFEKASPGNPTIAKLREDIAALPQK